MGSCPVNGRWNCTDAKSFANSLQLGETRNNEMIYPFAAAFAAQGPFSSSVLAYFMIFMALVTLPTLVWGPTAPYGRFSQTSGWGWLVPNRLAWITQEIPSLAVPVVWVAFFATGDQLANLRGVNLVLMSLFIVHYTNRDLIFPLRLRAGKPTPFLVWLLAFIFCVYNGFMQTRYLLADAPVVEPSPSTYLGVGIWVAGFFINLHSDHILISLRKDKKKGEYKIPRGGMFEYVSAANYFGEIVEWTGYAVASGFALPCVAFAVFTLANLFPRALAYHRFYLERFPSYRRLNRKACIPFLV